MFRGSKYKISFVLCAMDDNIDHLPFPKGFATAAIHHGQEPEQWDSMAVVPPLINSTVFKRNENPSDPTKNYEYSRVCNPTRDLLETVLAKLDNGKYGIAFSSCMGAVMAILSLLNTGDNIIACTDVYGGTQSLFNEESKRIGIEVTYIDFSDLRNLEKAIRPNTKIVYGESPSNPTLKVTDIKKAAEIAKKHNIIFVVDNTFLTPYLQRPLDLGADIVVYSITKYINGHSDVMMGSLILNDDKLYKKLRTAQIGMGAVPSPFDCHLVIRSVKTLALRMRQHSMNALIVAKYLEKHPKVEKVLHPGLKSHPQYELSKKQTSGHSGVFSFYLKGDLKDAKNLLDGLKLFCLTGSLGAVECLSHIPAIMSLARIPVEEREAMGVTENLIRLSIGIEDSEDIVADFEQAFQKMDDKKHKKYF